jgi:DNA-binding NarL/FixJ family response regulator
MYGAAVSGSRPSRSKKPLPPGAAEDIQRALVILQDVQQVVQQQIDRLNEAEQTLRSLVEEPPALRVPLTGDELAVLRLVAQGSTEVEIMAQVGVGPATIRSRMNRAIVKLRARNRVEAVLKAWKRGLI